MDLREKYKELKKKYQAATEEIESLKKAATPPRQAAVSTPARPNVTAKKAIPVKKTTSQTMRRGA